MKIKLINSQMDLIKERLTENIKEESKLRAKEANSEKVNGWDFIKLYDEKVDLKIAIKEGYINYEKI